MTFYFIDWFWRAIVTQCQRAVTLFWRLLDSPSQTTVAQSAPSPHICPRVLTYRRRQGPWRRHLLPTLPEHAFVIPDTVPHGDIYFYNKGEYVGTGATSFVDRLESGDIIKYPKPNPYCPEKENAYRQQMETEAKAYQRIGNNARVPRLIHWDASACSLVLEYLANGDLRSYLERYNQTVTSDQRQLWMRHAAEALAAVHSADIIHCDVTPRNFMLNEALELHIADFAGSSVAGSRPANTTSARFQRPGWSWDPTYADDLFALGSVFYFIQTGHEPYHDITEKEVHDRFKSAAFPEVSMLQYGNIIHWCWTGHWDNAQQIVNALAIAK
ncbi:Protein kinase-like domain [Cordyceps militaris CM01]|uniref:EKC/KEOPS complex subunit BUD32 n=1 Tax=Cordyceps militaris (strain CM01) TaxID=983644 RepID=G3J3D7_CORMM|nr:Protein kinase-like domain [Cordyceps militaris CM01]EGX95667.1 Protein kinase-like domain [Cordyceps militaris CM01]